MTTYSYTLTFDDSGSITLRAALEHYLDHCNHELASNARAPFYAHKKHTVDLLERLDENTIQTSGNNFWPNSGFHISREDDTKDD